MGRFRGAVTKDSYYTLMIGAIIVDDWDPNSIFKLRGNTFITELGGCEVSRWGEEGVKSPI